MDVGSIPLDETPSMQPTYSVFNIFLNKHHGLPTDTYSSR